MSTATLSVRPVESRGQRRDFMNLPKRIYQGDPHWIPPLWRVQEELVGFRPHPFWEFSQGQAFLAYRGNRPVGRVLAIVNGRHNERYQEHRGFFGFFECEDDAEAARGMLDAAAEWLRQRGMQMVRGPVNPSLNYEIGLLVDAFDRAPRFMMTYNPAYYERLLTLWGLVKVQDAYAYDADVSMLATLDPKIAQMIEMFKERFEVTCRPIDMKNFQRDIDAFVHIYNDSLQNTWGYVPMSDAEVRHMAHSLKLLIIPELTTIAEVKGKPVGVGFGLLDYNPLIKQIGGKLFPFGWLRLLLGRRKLTCVRLISTNVISEWQRWGLGLVVWTRVLPEALAFGIQDAEMSWVLESNDLSRGTIERGGGKLAKTYRLFDRVL